MNRSSRICILLSALILILFTTACRFDYEETMIAEDLSEEIPDTILKNFSQVMVKDSEPAFYIEASDSRSYSKRNETVFRDVHFQEFDSDGTVVTDGTADNAKMYNETEDVELWGSLRFYSSREEASLSGEYLYWDNENSTLSGRGNDRTAISRDDGSGISGSGFFADGKSKTIRFTGDVSGSWQDE